MTAATKAYLMSFAVQTPKVKNEYDFIKEAISNDKASRSGVMKLAWHYIKKFKLSLSDGLKKSWAVVREKIEKSIKAAKMDLSAWTKFS